MSSDLRMLHPAPMVELSDQATRPNCKLPLKKTRPLFETDCGPPCAARVKSEGREALPLRVVHHRQLHRRPDGPSVRIPKGLGRIMTRSPVRSGYWCTVPLKAPNVRFYDNYACRKKAGSEGPLRLILGALGVASEPAGGPLGSGYAPCWWRRKG